MQLKEPIGVCIVDSVGNVLHVSSGLCSLLRLRFSDSVRSLDQLVPPGAAQELREQIEYLTTSRRVHSARIHIEDRDGRALLADLWLDPGRSPASAREAEESQPSDDGLEARQQETARGPAGELTPDGPETGPEPEPAEAARGRAGGSTANSPEARPAEAAPREPEWREHNPGLPQGEAGGSLPGRTVTITLRPVHRERRLRKMHRRLGQVVARSPQAVMFLEPATHLILTANRSARRRTGYSMGELQGRPFHTLVPDELASRVQEAINRVARRESSFEVLDAAECSKEGVRYPAEIQFHYVHDPDEPGIAVISIDKRDWKAAQDVMSLAAMVFEHSREGLIITDPSGRIRFANQAFTVLIGYSYEEVAGNDARLYFRGLDGSYPPEDMWARAYHEGGMRLEFWGKTATNGPIALLVTVSPTADGGGRHDGFVVTFLDVTEQRRAQERAQFLAYHDSTTELPNREAFRRTLENHVANRAEPFAVAFINLARFKRINRHYGHITGDNVLRAIADRLRSTVPRSSACCHFGSDEFLVLLPSVRSGEEASDQVSRILDELSQPLDAGGTTFRATAQAGIALHPEHGTDPDALIQAAENGLQEAVERNVRLWTYSDEIRRRFIERITMENELRFAVEREELSLLYQPQVHLSDRRVAGHEALLRWNPRQLGPISPAVFIPVAEQSGVIHSIGTWVLHTACAERARLGSADGRRIAVNVSAVQLERSSFVEEVEHTLRGTGLPPGLLELEITESTIMRDVHNAVEILRALKGLGVGLAIDDFGTGYSSLGYLRQFPIDRLKVDASFIQDLDERGDPSGLIPSIIGMANGFKVAVVAEGVETPTQEAYLRENGCAMAQGFLYGAPEPLTDTAGLGYANSRSNSGKPTYEPGVGEADGAEGGGNRGGGDPKSRR